MLIKNNKYVNWLRKRISIIEIEKKDETYLQNKIAKGGKLRAYKEILNYYLTHVAPSDKSIKQRNILELIYIFILGLIVSGLIFNV